MTLCALGIETSCDETAVSILEADERGCRLLGEALATRPEEHAALGGIVPELTVRQHLELLPRILGQAKEKAGKRPFQVVGADHDEGLVDTAVIGVGEDQDFGSASGESH